MRDRRVTVIGLHVPERRVSPIWRSSSTSAAASVADRDRDVPVLDVCTPSEIAGGHLEGAVDVGVLADSFQKDVEALELPGSGPEYVHCQPGSRSRRAARVLRRMGHTGAVDVDGFGAPRAAGSGTTR
ncbi:rhodanese-like domain-containing protein [Rubrivirga sp.]|uniref:rhodanese-like domain-containing protein n=1 Tax=Rubrivirga sp. TaxID=1885344 RepID=UPI003C706D5A